jgi:hypothetical protein
LGAHYFNDFWLIAISMLAIMIFSYGKTIGHRATVSARAVESNDEETPTKHETMEPAAGEQPAQGQTQTRVLPILAAAIGFSLSVVAQTSCSYVST